jgi:hypothetical protein
MRSTTSAATIAAPALGGTPSAAVPATLRRRPRPACPWDLPFRGILTPSALLRECPSLRLPIEPAVCVRAAGQPSRAACVYDAPSRSRRRWAWRRASEESGLGPRRDVRRHLEVAERAAALGVDDALAHASLFSSQAQCVSRLSRARPTPGRGERDSSCRFLARRGRASRRRSPRSCSQRSSPERSRSWRPYDGHAGCAGRGGSSFPQECEGPAAVATGASRPDGG